MKGLFINRVLLHEVVQVTVLRQRFRQAGCRADHGHESGRAAPLRSATTLPHVRQGVCFAVGIGSVVISS